MATRLFVFLTLLGSLSGAWALEHDECAYTYAQRARLRSISRLESCMSYYFYHQQFEADQSPFWKVTQLGLRILELDPTQTGVYSDVAWLFYSQWRMKEGDPDFYNDAFSEGPRLARELLARGAAALPEDPQYFYEKGMIEWIFVRYQEEWLEPAVASFLKSAELSSEIKVKVRSRLNAGHIYRKAERLEEAREQYQAVLALDPGNEVALRYL
jgi:tetratricopeptide (TPR) repeat protein